jgi:PST family polysaccharide transporter
MHSSVTKRTVSGFIWIFSGSAVQSLLRIGVLVVLARLLSPTEFGLVGAATVVISLADVFSQLGVSPAIVQRPDLDDTHISAGFTVSLLLGLVTGLLVAALSPWLARAFNINALTPIIAALALSFPLRGCSVVAEALLQRAMRFRAIAGVTIASFILGYAFVSVTLALLGWGVWSLVFGQLTQTLFMTGGYLYYARHSLALSLNRPAMGQLLHFGTGISVSRIGNYIALNADNFIVGRYLGASALGFYSRAYQFLMQPTNLIGSVVDRVLFPAMVSVQNDREKLTRGYRRCVALSAMITLPLSALLIVLAPDIIRLLLGQKWLGMTVPFQILAVSLVGRTGYKTSDTLARAKGAVYSGAWRQWIYAVEIVVGAGLGLRWGLTGVACGVTIAILMQYAVMLDFGRRFADVSWLDLAWLHLRHLGIALVVAAVSLACKSLASEYHVVSVVTMLGAGLGAVMTLFVLWRVVPGIFGDEGRWTASIVRERSLRL